MIVRLRNLRRTSSHPNKKGSKSTPYFWVQKTVPGLAQDRLGLAPTLTHRESGMCRCHKEKKRRRGCFIWNYLFLAVVFSLFYICFL